jgi:hypothetical protein
MADLGSGLIVTASFVGNQQHQSIELETEMTSFLGSKFNRQCRDKTANKQQATARINTVATLINHHPPSNSHDASASALRVLLHAANCKLHRPASPRFLAACGRGPMMAQLVFLLVWNH